MKLRTYLGFWIGAGTGVFLLLIGATFFLWQEKKTEEQRRLVREDAWELFQGRYDAWQEELSEHTQSMVSRLQDRVAIVKSREKLMQAVREGPTSSAWSEWLEFLCLSRDIAYSRMVNPERQIATLFTGRSAQEVSLQYSPEPAIALPDRAIWEPLHPWKILRDSPISVCEERIFTSDLLQSNEVWALDHEVILSRLKALRSVSDAWPWISRLFLGSSVQGIVLSDEQGKTSLLNRSQVLQQGTPSATLFGIAPEVKGVSRLSLTSDGQDLIYEIFLPLEEGTSLTLGTDLLHAVGRFAAHANASFGMVLQEDRPLVAYRHPSFDLPEAVLEKQLSQPGILQQAYGRLTIEGKEFFFAQFQPLPQSELRVWIAQDPFLPHSLASKRMEEVETWLQETKTLLLSSGICLLIALALWSIVGSRRIGKPIEELTESLDQMLQQEELGPPPKMRSSKVEELQRLFHSEQRLYHQLQERFQLERLLDSFVAPEIAVQLRQGVVHRGGARYEAVLLFADLRGFTQVASHLRPDEVCVLLNSCFSDVCPPIEAAGGVIDKFIGDSCMAVFGAPHLIQDPIGSAVRAALEMREALGRWNAQRIKRGLFPMEIGWGLAAGEVTAGVIGTPHRKNFSVLGSVVNRASRLCDRAGPGEILVDATILTTLEAAKKEVIRVEEEAHLKGFEHSMRIGVL